jgi:hypothetical protein
MRRILRDFSRKTRPAIALLARRRFPMTFYNLAQKVEEVGRQIALMVRGADVGASNEKSEADGYSRKPCASTSITSQKLSTFASLNAA